MPRRTTRRTTKIVLNRYKIAGGLLGAGILYFFSLYMAPESPLFSALSYPTHQGFGEKGSFIFFGLVSLFGLITLIWPKYYSRWLFKFGFIVLMLVCGILNFELLDAGFNTATVNAASFVQGNGGWLGYLVLWGSSWLFGAAALATKFFVIGLLIAAVIAIGIYYKVKLPTFHLEIVSEHYKQAVKNTRAVRASTAKKTTKASNLSGFDDNTDTAFTAKASADTQAQTLKSLIKDKLKTKVKKKEDDKTLQQLHINFPKDKPTFESSLLIKDVEAAPQVSEERLYEKAQAIKSKLAEFNIAIDIEGFNVGPTVLQIKIQPQAGIKVSKIENLKKDLALALKTKSLRVLAPIPGGDSVGIELPNPKPQLVRIREVMEGLNFTKSMSDNFSNLTIGKSIDGSNVVKSLESMPHLLVAGATGSGKSVGVNGFITSLMYQNTPSELKFIMVDPKQVELGIYEGMPYLLAPIITKADKAVKVLKRSVNYMEERYGLLKDKKARNLEEYNAKVDEKEKMYRLVIIIDELADLMMSGNKKDTENYITRIAQKARAVGIHLILATQRPSVNVITGLIKANIPTRIAFGVVSQIDSRTILDVKGAEDLVGKGDLLYMDPKSKFPIRVQGPLITTEETEDMVRAIQDKYMSNLTESDIYHPEIMRILENKGEYAGAGGDVSSGDEELIEQAMDIISRTGKASATMLQRKLGVGFPRAARLIDILEERGVVGPQEGAKAREILI